MVLLISFVNCDDSEELCYCEGDIQAYTSYS